MEIRDVTMRRQMHTCGECGASTIGPCVEDAGYQVPVCPQCDSRTTWPAWDVFDGEGRVHGHVYGGSRMDALMSIELAAEFDGLFGVAVRPCHGLKT